MVEPVATSKHMDNSYSHTKGNCTEGLLGRHAIGMLGRTLESNTISNVLNIISLCCLFRILKYASGWFPFERLFDVSFSCN